MYPFIKNQFFTVAREAPAWNRPPPIPDEEANKKLFGIELAKNNKPFDAANIVFPDDVKIALWVAQNWLTDPVVVANKDLYGETVKLNTPILDKQQLAAKVLQLAEADDVDPKDRVAAFKLYSEIAEYTGKVNIDASSKTYIDKSMKVTFVKASNKPDQQTIEHSEIKEINSNNNVSPLKIKLVKASA